MNKKQIIDFLAKEMGMSKAAVKETVLPAIDKLVDAIVEADGATLNGVCKATVQTKKGRKGVMPTCGKAYDHSNEERTTVVIKFPR